ncbi:MAG: TonB-dependent receptor [Rhodothermales bacterium]|nr:TonB-dependent receptor [Rhodothermales bacterium]
MRSVLLFLVVLLLFVPTAVGQSGTIQGVVFDETGEVLAGANIFILGTRVGRSTDIDGRYSIRLSPGTYTLQASFIGYTAVQRTLTLRADDVLVQDFILETDLVGVDEVVVLGSRRSGRTVLESAVPIDVLTPDELEATGASETTQVLAALIPSYNSPQASITDGSDHVRPATLRNQGPDQVLVLVNGKRRHTTALVHVNGSVGRGSTGVDMNSIPAAMIERVEVLRDGAAAQYGSDAIAGVINIVLKERTGFDAQVTLGQHFSIVDRGYTESEALLADLSDSSSYDWDGNGVVGPIDAVRYTDGKTANVNLGYGLEFGKASLFVGGSLRHRDHINRAGLDPRQQYYSGDPESRESSFNRLNHRYGNGEFDDLSIFANGSIPVGARADAYAFGGVSDRDGLSGCFYRRSLDNRTNRSLYPNGFLPKINAKVRDISGAVGVKGAISGWTYDLSETIGTNSFNFNTENSHNASLDNSPTNMDSGTLEFTQATTNADLFRTLDIGTSSPLSIGVGAEFRFENYEITPGEEASYIDGGVAVRDGPNAGDPTAAGAQCFPGFQPATARDENRTNVGVYVDIENNVTDNLLVSLAGRAENYSDFGSTVTGKLAARLGLTNALAVRGAVSTGFRAPSLAQAWFTSIATNFIGGVPFEVGTFPVDSEVARALGAEDLDPEKSTNISSGVTFGSSEVALTVDGYMITVRDRITFTENFVDEAVADFLLNEGIDATGGRYFTNALDTRTTGLDVTGRVGRRVGNGRARVTVALTFSDTEVTNTNDDGVIAAPEQLVGLNEPELVSRVRIGDFEVAQPNNKQNVQANYDHANFRIMARVVRYGSVTAINSNPDQDETFGSRAVTDVELGYVAKDGFHFAIGASNLFDVYPDKQLKSNSFNGIFPYDGFSPFGFFGRFVYVRASISLDAL